ncbi:M28 family metallopeptidase [Marinicella litoralis]|uniref:Zn-dependent M28 family amino/carboxypeptidase n=1 Tax=Marinicella litoralis TaxID=644220 RepID=A0A4R6XIR2_9GAMM|nr:M28 family metallopeptidase [Marinicella litoralis]TDR19375.1 Zn-dependent M28 family amino/carboxypeptidase [Marinicella litoralis]
MTLKFILNALLISCTCLLLVTPDAHSDTAQRFEAHMDFLASDLLRGRDTGSVGHEIAAQYIATEFAKLGIIPAGDNGGYQQRVPFKSALLDLDSPKLMVSHDAGEHEFKFMSEFLVGADVSRTESAVSAELVFAGFGIDAPFLNYSDFDQIDLQGKIAVVLRGKPITFPSEEGAHYSRTSTQALVDRGAIAVISVSTPQMEKIWGFDRGKAYIDKPKISWINAQGAIGKGNPEIMAAALLSVESGKKLFALAGMDMDAIIEQTEKGEQPKAQNMGLTASISYQSSHSQISSPNVIGILEGADPVLKDEYVLLSAHTDHIGVSTHIELGDKINNGAMDNAAGVTTLLEMAYQITQLNQRPKRSILFAMVTAEEKGLLGSDYFAHNPTVPIDSIVANINLDMPILTNAFDQLIGFGAQHSSLWGVIEGAVKQHGMNLIPDPMPEQSIFVRSDQYSFVKKGIPAVFLVTADNANMVFEAHEVSSQEFRMQHYHKPSDQLDLPINYEVAAKFVAINRVIVSEVANAEERPSWNKDSFFATIKND